MSFNKFIHYCALIIMAWAMPVSLAAQVDFENEDDESFRIGATLQHITTVEAEIDLQLSLSVSTSADDVDLLSDTKKALSSEEIPGIVRITGGSLEVMLDIENPEIQDKVDDHLIKIYDFQLGKEGSGNSTVVLPASDVPSFTIAIGAKAEVFGQGSVNYFGNNVLSANYL